jgi:hypothetical protein
MLDVRFDIQFRILALNLVLAVGVGNALVLIRSVVVVEIHHLLWIRFHRVRRPQRTSLSELLLLLLLVLWLVFLLMLLLLHLHGLQLRLRSRMLAESCLTLTLTWVLPGGIGLDGHDLRWVARSRSSRW